MRAQNPILSVSMLVVLLVGCSAEEGPAPDVGAKTVPGVIADAVADQGRPDEDRARDANRRPGEVLAFFGIEEGMRVADLQASSGYYTELLSRIVGSGGQVFAQNNRFVNNFAGADLDTRLGRLGQANIAKHDAELGELYLPRRLDAVLLIRFYHDLFWLPDGEGRVDRAAFNREVFDALKPGGIFGVVDHHAEEGSEARDAVDPREGLHRIDAAVVKREILAAGFELDGESSVLSNPADSRDWNIFVDDGARRDTTDRFVYRFRKP